MGGSLLQLIERRMQALVEFAARRAPVVFVVAAACAMATAPQAVFAAEVSQQASPLAGVDAVSIDAPSIETLAAMDNSGTFSLTIDGAYHQGVARELLDLVNAARANVGVAPLKYDESLEKVAMLRAAETAVSFSHTRLDGSSCFTASDDLGVRDVFFCGENILMGAYNATDANRWWTESPGHYTNMITARFTSVGFGVFEREGHWYWAECFGEGGGTGFVTQAVNGAASVDTRALPQYIGYQFTDVNNLDWYIKPDASDFLYCLNNGFMGGYGNHTFAPYENVTRGQVATILWRLAGEPLASATAFADVNYDEYYGKAVTWARATSVVSGYPNNTFAPDKPVSREELVSMMRNYAIKIAHMDPVSSSSKAEAMPDWASVSAFARPAFAWAIEEGILSGVSDHGVSYLKPQDGAWRVSAALMMTRFHRDILN